MESYTLASQKLAEQLTREYSTSFSAASRFFVPSIRTHIYDIYGLVRIADEIVDSYDGSDRGALLDEFEHETYAAIKRGYSTNPIIHAFAFSAKKFSIGANLIKPFFASMRMDLSVLSHDQASYERYIYGSAEVVGLMCLKVLTAGNTKEYERLAPGARRLGAAYQKVNYLRDIADDYAERQRYYFPEATFETFDESVKSSVIADIRENFTEARSYIAGLPRGSRTAVAIRSACSTVRSYRAHVRRQHMAVSLGARQELRCYKCRLEAVYISKPCGWIFCDAVAGLYVLHRRMSFRRYTRIY